jgi:tetraacyldisaccharide 4'-kinase
LADSYPNSCERTSARILPDHDPLTDNELWDGLPIDLPIIVTAKDWVKLRERSDVKERDLLVALQDVELEPPDEFRKWIKKSFDE